MSKWTKFGAVALAVAVAAGCGDDDGGPSGDPLSQSEKTALANALATTEFGGLAAFVVQAVGSVGTLDATAATAAVNAAMEKAMSLSVTGSAASAYEGAVGIAIEFSISAQGLSETGWFYGVFGWNDINTSNSTVGEWVIVGGVGEGGSLPTSASGTIQDGDIFAEYYGNNTFYWGLEGEASASGSFSGSSTDCGQSAQGVTVECSYTAGTMNGNFLFSAESDGGSTYTQSKVQFSSLPAVKMVIDLSQ